MICPRCQTNNPDAARFCMACGLELVRTCPNCHAVLSQGARFCMACGQPVLQQTSTDLSRLSRLAAAVPDDLIQKIRTARQSSPVLPPGSLGEQRTITTLLVDVVGSTALSTQLGAGSWADVIDQAFNEIALVIYRFEGTIVRALGDTLLAFFGAPVAHEDDPVRAVQAGLELIAHMRDYSRQLKQRYAIDYAVRACINTGPVVIGPLADDLTYNYSTEGATINLTSRIKFASQEMGVLVTSNTYRFIAPYFECRELTPQAGVGSPGALRVFQVKAPRPVLGSARGFKDLRSPMVGRKQELASLMRLCDTVRAGLGRGVLVVGEPGLGKTRLIQEWQKAVDQVAASPAQAGGAGHATSQRWVTGRCTSFNQGVPYQLVMDVLKDLIGVSEGSEEPEIRTALLKFTQHLLGDGMMEVYPYLGRLLSLKLEGAADEKANISDPQALQNQYLQAIQQVFVACIQQAPLILVLEDLHWADGASLDLFIRLLPLISRGPVLFCLVTRPERTTPGWRLVEAAREQLGGSLAEIDLKALSESDSQALVENLLEVESLPRQLRQLILHKAEGNPYFVEEVIRMLIERQAIVNHDGRWLAQEEISEREIPDNLQGLLLARIDALPRQARFTLLVASVIGRNFPVRVLSEVMAEV